MKCEHEFQIQNSGKPVVSCPVCGILLNVELAEVSALNPSFKVVAESQKSIILTPRKHSAHFKCLGCAKTFLFEKLFKDPKRRYTDPHCPRCSSTNVQALTPVAAAHVRGQAVTKKGKLARFVRRNFKALCEIRAAVESFPDMVKRAGLPETAERRLLDRAKRAHQDILNTVESHANDQLRERMREMGFADGEDVL